MKTLFLILSQGWLEIAVAVGLVLLLRLCLRPFPKYLTCLLWLGVLFRLLCPFSLPKAASPLPAIPAPVILLSSALTGSPQPAPAAGSFDWLGLLSLLWLAGLAFFLLKGLISLLSLKKRLKGAQKLCDNIYVFSRIPTPFVFGIFRPVILLPAHTPETMLLLSSLTKKATSPGWIMCLNLYSIWPLAFIGSIPWCGPPFSSLPRIWRWPAMKKPSARFLRKRKRTILFPCWHCRHRARPYFPLYSDRSAPKSASVGCSLSANPLPRF